MRYGVGTGCCGTKSLAKVLGGIHEPPPQFYRETHEARWARDPKRKEHCRELCREQARRYKALDTPIVVHNHLSYNLDLLVEEDPEAELVLIYRDPVLIAKNKAMEGNRYFYGDEPDGPWPVPEWGRWRAYKRFAWMFNDLHEKILEHRERIVMAYRANDMPIVLNRKGRSFLRPQEADYVREATKEMWKRLEALRGEWTQEERTADFLENPMAIASFTGPGEKTVTFGALPDIKVVTGDVHAKKFKIPPP